jgi:predicted lipoprotein
MPAAAKWGIGATVVVVFLWFFPLFRVVPLGESRQQAAAVGFDAAAFVDAFWVEELLPAAATATDAAELRAALQTDRDAAGQAHGHRLGMSGSVSFLVQGEGRIVGVSDDAVEISLGGASQETVDLRIETGPVFGNAIRDGSGLLDVSAFSNTRDFNALSSEINLRVETQVLPSLRAKARVGKTVHFAGGVELAEYDGVADPLGLVPVTVEFP